MRGFLVLLVLAVGCADSDPHELGHCDSAWGQVTACEAACEAGPTADPGFGTCITGHPPGSPAPSYCPKANERDGGCCLVTGGYVRWYECLKSLDGAARR